ncbi:MAG: acyl-CoA dehydrogenase family protein [Oligoflexia bacterium]|nr:acyl-CoA dehydrogenase family protein [Oligoflexia bacterium]
MNNDFFQNPPELKNQFLDDKILQSCLEWLLPKEVYKKIQKHLEHLGQRAITDLLQYSKEAEANPPRHIPYDPWGKRIDHVEVSQAWKNLEVAAAEEGIVASGYARKYDEYSRIYQAALLYLYHPSSAIFSCPLAMTDGAAKAFELFGQGKLKKKVLKHLTSTNPKEFWTSGQWMTEKTGGSDVSGTSTVAKKVGKNYELFGTKWFTSASTSQMAMLLAKTEKGLSLFYTEVRNKNNQLNKITINRLKDKLGTKALPTAELTLNGTPAILIGEEGRGVKNISALFNITRLYNSVCATANMRRGYALANDYAYKRKAFGKLLIDQPLHGHTLKQIETDVMACLFFTFYTMGLQGRDDLGKAIKEEKLLLRILTPLVKLYTAKKALITASEVLESFGGAGYVEDTGLPFLLKEAQVFSIWEGTTNVLCLDVLRSMQKENTLPVFIDDVKQKIKCAGSNLGLKKYIEEKLLEINKFVKDYSSDAELFQTKARRFSFMLCETYIAALFFEFESKNKDKAMSEIIKTWLLAR